jgi:hypothetical protein
MGRNFDMPLKPLLNWFKAGSSTGQTIYFPEWPQRVTGVLSQENSRTQARLDMFQLPYT